MRLTKVLVISPPFGFSPNDVSNYYSQAFKEITKTYDFYIDRHVIYHSLAFDNLVAIGQLQRGATIEEIMSVIRRELLGTVLELKPDVIVVVHAFYMDDVVLGTLRELADMYGMKLVMVATESPHNKSEEIRANKFFDLTVCTDSSGTEYLYNAVYLGHSYSHITHVPTDISRISTDYIRDIGFVGAFFPERISIFEKLVSNGFTAYLSGLIDDFIVSDTVVPHIRPNLVDNFELAKLYSGATFSINFTRRSMYLSGTGAGTIQHSMTIRMIECMASGGILVTDETEELVDLCTEGMHYIGYTTADELVDKLKYYKEQPDKLSRMRVEAYHHIRSIKNSYLENAKKVLSLVDYI